MSSGTNPIARDAAGPAAPGLAARLIGLGSIFGKTFRDSRGTALYVGVVMAMIVVVTGAAIAAEFDTAAKRLAIAAQMTRLPAIMQGVLGEMIAIERLGGFMSWRSINFLPIIVGIWSVVAMSGLLAAELGRGSLDLLAITPRGRARIALEKLGGYLLALLVATLLFAAGAYLAIAAFGTLPDDPVGLDAVLGHGAWLYAMALVPGGTSFAVAPFLGRGGALAVGGMVLFASLVVDAYGSMVSVLEPLEPLSYFSITASHRPIAGAWDWPSIALIGAAAAGVLAAGVVAFARRDMLVPTGGSIRLPSLRVFLGGPFSRALGERLPAAALWGAGIGLFGLIISASSDEFVATLASIPQIAQMIRQFFPNADLLSAGGFMQLAFFSEAILFVAIATSVLVAGWASDESERRLEVLLSAPVTRAGWAVRTGLAVMAGITVIIAVLVIAVVIGASTQAAGRDLGRLAVGISVLGLYAAAIAGIGLAVGGLVRPSLAAPVVLTFAIGFFLWDVIGSIVRLPDELLDLALQRHLGRPIIGEFDWPGMVACVVIAVGGLALSAIGMRRRDIGP